MVRETNPSKPRTRWPRGLWMLPLIVGLALAPARAAARSPGYVPSDAFVDIAGQDALQVQVSIGPSLLRMIANADPELKRLIGGLDSIEAVILDLDRNGVAARAKDAMIETERRLLRAGWERLVLVREEDSEARVLILNSDEAVHGLVVMVMEEDQMVFANISGVIDLAAIGEIGKTLDVPGLGDIDLKGAERHDQE